MNDGDCGVGTTGMDCPAHQGIHVWEDHYILEVIDPWTWNLSRMDKKASWCSRRSLGGRCQ
jgi:phenylacetate-coenzyme A ligase PaaK-like adenylate-forming protein